MVKVLHVCVSTVHEGLMVLHQVCVQVGAVQHTKWLPRLDETPGKTKGMETK